MRSVTDKFDAWWAQYGVGMLCRLPWVKGVAKEAFDAGRRSAR